jgi:hypothetical protein
MTIINNKLVLLLQLVSTRNETVYETIVISHTNRDKNTRKRFFVSKLFIY